MSLEPENKELQSYVAHVAYLRSKGLPTVSFRIALPLINAFPPSLFESFAYFVWTKLTSSVCSDSHNTEGGKGL